ncbi:acid phosphatase/Vanadium-dependent haloperoxidase [Hypoxylon sp. NC1633]|nr:acid phosphatase/Vanadium-dependent haloperoxidase [Hypoxylon sp. NC1633]
MDPYLGGRRQRRTPPAPNSSSATRREKWRRRLHFEPYSMAKRPSFSLWLRISWPDILTMFILGAIAIGVYHIPPAARRRMFPLTVRDARTGEDTGEVVYPELAYPYRAQIISSWLDVVLAILIPLFFFVVMQFRIRSFWDFHNAIFGFIYALETSAAFQVMIKWLIGGLRPNFYEVCAPDMKRASIGIGYRQYMFTPEICTTSQARPLWNAMQSFPSGHSTTISAAAVYLYLYLNAKLKIFANYHASMWKLILLYCPILGAVLVCGSLHIDRSHNLHDIIAGVIIGTIFAFSAYRMVYASIWDWRVNHVPLNRGSPFVWSDGCDGSGSVCTSRAGWRPRPSEKEKGTLPDPVPGSEMMEGITRVPSQGLSSSNNAGPNDGNDHNLRQPQHPIQGSGEQGADMV